MISDCGSGWCETRRVWSRFRCLTFVLDGSDAALQRRKSHVFAALAQNICIYAPRHLERPKRDGLDKTLLGSYLSVKLLFMLIPFF